jgi:hypothetical protein
MGQTDKVVTKLKECADLFENKNAEHGSAYLLVGEVLEKIIPDGVKLETSDDFTIFLMFAISVMKKIRAANAIYGDVVPFFDSATDSLVDDAIYTIMAACELENKGQCALKIK